MTIKLMYWCSSKTVHIHNDIWAYDFLLVLYNYHDYLAQFSRC